MVRQGIMWNQGNWQVFSAGSPPPRSQLERNGAIKDGLGY
jgi:hypothetical protein